MRKNCFGGYGVAPLDQAVAWPLVDCQGLGAAQCQDLAEVLPYLACGEISAVLAFTGRLLRGLPEAAQQDLQSMARDEQRHALLIEQIQKHLPAPQLTSDHAHMVMFFRRLESSNPAEHLAKIAALDRAVCQLLHPLLRRGAALDAAPALHRALSALRQDEARHVCMTRTLAQQLGGLPAHQTWLNHEVGQRMHLLLKPVHAALRRLSAPQHQPPSRGVNP